MGLSTDSIFIAALSASEDIMEAVRTMRDLGPVLEKYNGIHFKSAREKYFREHGEEIIPSCCGR